MPATGYTPILLYGSATGGSVPAASNLTNGTGGSEIAINITDGLLYYKDDNGAVQIIGTKLDGTLAAGLQYPPMGTGAAVLAAAITAPAPNLLANGSGELAGVDWLLPPQAGYATGLGGEGTYFTIASAVNGTYIAISADYAVGPAVALTLQAEIFASGLTAGQLAMDLEFLDSTHTVIASAQAKSTVSADQNWTFMSNSASTPANTAYWHARFFMAGATLTTGALRKIKVSNGITPSPYSREADFPAIQANFAALNGSFTQPFNVAPAAAGPQAVRLTQTIGGGATQYGNFTSQRAFGTVYINSSGRPLAVVISAEIPTGVNVTLSDGFSQYFYGGASNHGSSEGNFTFFSLVPTGATYFVFGASGAVLLSWFEY